MSGARGGVLWFTGLPGSGKSTISDRVCEELERRKIPYEHLDGDAIRAVFPATGFGAEERKQHIKRVGFLASMLEKHGVFVVVSLVSPYQDARDFARARAKRFIEVYLSTPLETCEKRDPKGMYAKARKGLIQHFTGVDDPYEPPKSPELTLDTSKMTVDQAVARVMERVAL